MRILAMGPSVAVRGRPPDRYSAVTLGVVPLSGPAGANVVVAARRQD
ncbi:hypothetical protein [Myxococcus sp. NMCA1]|nr:hypothetical protein [Myxococcus sp. NMCA1]WAM27107.1 hypothetical protein OZ403_03030 [Myxococcus sp. NMCA1]